MIRDRYWQKIKCLLRSILFICFLNDTVLGARTTCEGREFQIGTTRLEKKYFWMFDFASGTVSFNGWPHKFWLGLKMWSGWEKNYNYW